MPNKAFILDKNNKIISQCFAQLHSDDKGEITDFIEKEAGFSVGENIYFFMVSRNIVYQGTIYDKNAQTLFLKELKELNKDVRVNMGYKTKITCTDKDRCYILPVLVLDISSGGICVCSKRPLSTSLLYETVVPITVEPMVLKFKVIRELKVGAEEGYVYGCAFLDMCQDEERILREAVLRIGSNKHKKARG